MRLLPLPGVFQPPSDAHLLAGHLRRELRRPGLRVLDLCTGSGFLALAAAEAGAAEVTAVDISRRAIASVRLNAALNGLRVKTVRGDLFAAVGGERFDLIVSNPPYLPTPQDVAPRGIARATEAGRSGRVFIDRICAGAAAHLSPAGVLLLVHSTVCGERQTLEALASAGLEAAVAARDRGPLGPMLQARADWLRAEGLLLEHDEEEVFVFTARRSSVRHPSADAAPDAERARVSAR